MENHMENQMEHEMEAIIYRDVWDFDGSFPT